jgi:thymidylate synthase (FAD)
MQNNKDLIGKQVEVLDKGWIELHDMMGDDLAIVNAARVSFLGESKGPKKDKKLLLYLMEHRHTSPFEQVQLKFRIRAPLLTWWQWVRHRTWSYNAQSGRYTPFKENDFHIPKANQWRLQSKDNKQGSDGFLIDSEDVGGVPQLLTDSLERMVAEGYNAYQVALQYGVAKEQARMLLHGFAVYYTWVCGVDAHNLMNFLRLRMAPDAQYEIRVYAQAIYDHFFKPALPWTAEAFEKFKLNKLDGEFLFSENRPKHE